jgi:elongation factor Tu
MSKELFDKAKPHVNLGSIGHVDHGKTTLTAAICKALEPFGTKVLGVDKIDKAPEENLRGVTISSSHIEMQTANRHYSWVDCPGHADYVKNMIIGSDTMDYAVLVIAITDGVMPQTREHLLLASKKGIKKIAIFVNKVDAISNKEEFEIAKELLLTDLQECLERYGFISIDTNLEGINEHGYSEELLKGYREGIISSTPVIYGSALNALNGNQDELENIRIFFSNIVDIYFELPEREIDKPFLMPVSEVMSITGRGTVATGKIARGKISEGEKVAIVGFDSDMLATVIGIESFKKILKIGEAGDNVGILLRGVNKEQIKRGHVLALPGSITPHSIFEAQVYVLSKEEGGRHTPFASNYRPQFYFRTTDVTGIVSLPEDIEIVMPGDNVSLKVNLIDSIALEEGSLFSVREGGRTVAQGIVSRIIEKEEKENKNSARSKL